MDGLEADLRGKVEVLRLDILNGPGRELARRYGVRAVPVFLLFDGQGNLIQQHSGIPNRDALREAALALSNRG
ncbi:MAG: thioredoxin family protein [Anaerolineae bacterium]|nr:thioredoxin family protein [Anaerolineae bacterium]